MKVTRFKKFYTHDYKNISLDEAISLIVQSRNKRNYSQSDLRELKYNDGHIEWSLIIFFDKRRYIYER